MGVNLPQWGLKGGNPLSTAEQAHPAGRDKAPWFQRTLVGMEVGRSETDPQHPAKDPTFYSRANGKAIVQNLLKARAEYAVIFMKDWNFAYYNSRIVRKCPSLGRRDLLREVLDEAGKYHLPIIAYVVIQGDTSVWLAHPEWRMEVEWSPILRQTVKTQIGDHSRCTSRAEASGAGRAGGDADLDRGRCDRPAAGICRAGGNGAGGVGGESIFGPRVCAN